MHTGLILIDIQNDYFPGGSCELFQAEHAALQAKKVLAYFREHKMPIYHIQHINTRPNAAFFLPNTDGAMIYPLVFPLKEEKHLIKHTPNSFFQTQLKDALDASGVDHLVICGMMTHMCVDTTVRAAKDLGYSVALIEDACAGKSLEWNEVSVPAPTVQASYMAALNGSFAQVTSAGQWLQAARRRLPNCQ